jgi:IMP dehydrogenase
VVTIAPNSSIGHLVRLLADTRVSGLPVVDPAERVVGTVSATDVSRASGEKDDTKARSTTFEHTMVRDIMTPNPRMIGPDANAREAARQMFYTEVRRFIVVN